LNRPLNLPKLVSRPEANGQAIGDRPGPWDNFTKKVGPVAAPGGQLTLKDDSEAKIPKGPKIKEKNLKSDKPEPSEKAQESDKTKKNSSLRNSIKSK